MSMWEREQKGELRPPREKPGEHGREMLAVVVASVEAMVREDPDITGAAVLENLKVVQRQAVEFIDAMAEVAVCRHCGQQIGRPSADARWRHEDEARSVGCRAASFGEGGWNESLPRGWRASPRHA